MERIGNLVPQEAILIRKKFRTGEAVGVGGGSGEGMSSSGGPGMEGRFWGRQRPDFALFPSP